MTRTAALLAALSTLAAHAGPPRTAQQARDKKDIHQDKRELARDRAEVADDRADLVRVRLYVQRFEQLRAAADWNMMASLDKEVSRFLAGERTELQREAGQAAAEVVRSAGETVAAAGEAVADARRGRGAAVQADSRRDLRDDKRDLKDDRRDLQAEAAARNRMAALQGRWNGLAGRYDAPSLDARGALLKEMEVEQAKDLRRTAAEYQEDKRELREDRRELREDRRQRSAAHAAPNPLSMFITGTPCAQEDSMALSAACPPSATP